MRRIWDWVRDTRKRRIAAGLAATATVLLVGGVAYAASPTITVTADSTSTCATDGGTPGTCNGTYTVAAGHSLTISTPTPPPPPSSVDTVFGNAVPATPDVNGPDHEPLNFGLKFHTTVAGHLLGVRFYKSAANVPLANGVGTHYGTLFDANGNILAQAEFTNETAFGWEDVRFSRPVAIAANVSYTAAVSMIGGYEAYDPKPFPLVVGPISADNSTYIYSHWLGRNDAQNCFPSYSGYANYYIDVDFAAGGTAQPTAPARLTFSEAQQDAGYMVRSHGYRTAHGSINCTRISASTLHCRITWTAGGYSYTAVGRFWNYILSDGNPYWWYDFRGTRTSISCMRHRRPGRRCSQTFHWH
jgi:hypothetical protein